MSETRRSPWVVFAYYYVAALIGLVMMVVGAVRGVNGVVSFALPETSDEVRYAVEPYAARGPEGGGGRLSEAEEQRIKDDAVDRARDAALGDLLTGVLTAAIGGPVMGWHLRQARRREPEWSEENAEAPKPDS